MKTKTVTFGVAYVVMDDGVDLLIRRKDGIHYDLKFQKGMRLSFDGIKDGSYRVVKDTGRNINLKRDRKREP